MKGQWGVKRIMKAILSILLLLFIVGCEPADEVSIEAYHSSRLKADYQLNAPIITENNDITFTYEAPAEDNKKHYFSIILKAHFRDSSFEGPIIFYFLEGKLNLESKSVYESLKITRRTPSSYLIEFDGAKTKINVLVDKKE